MDSLILPMAVLAAPLTALPITLLGLPPTGPVLPPPTVQPVGVHLSLEARPTERPLEPDASTLAATQSPESSTKEDQQST